MYWEIIVGGLPTTLAASVCAWLMAVVLGLLLGIVADSGSRLLLEVQFFLSTVMRGFPELLAIYLLYYGLNDAFGVSPFVATVLALGLTQTGFAAEAVKAVLQVVPAGQRAAASSMGFSRWQTYRLVLLPQTIRALVPAWLNMYIGLLKLTTYAAAVGLGELLYNGQTVMNLTYEVVPVAVLLAGVYIIITVPLSSLVTYLESRRQRRFNVDSMPRFT